LDSATIDQSQFITSGQLDDLRDGYFKKIFDLKSLSRFFTLQSDYRLLFKSVFNPLRKRIRHYTSYLDDRKQESNENNSLPESNLNPHFPEAFIRFVSMKKVLLIFSETDRLYWEFDEKFYPRYKATLQPYALNFEIYVVPGANHIFSFSEWQNELFHKLREWLQTNFAERAA
jgi:hypothetical protein